MSRELSLRQQAIRLKYAGWSVSRICAYIERSRDWFYKWWNRYLAEGSGGLRDRPHAPHTFRVAWAPEVRQAIATIRNRLMLRHGRRKRYSVGRRTGHSRRIDRADNHWRDFLRRVRCSGCITILGVQFRLGKRCAHQYITARLYTRTMLLKVSARERLLKHFAFPFVGKLQLYALCWRLSCRLCCRHSCGGQQLSPSTILSAACPSPYGLVA